MIRGSASAAGSGRRPRAEVDVPPTDFWAMARITFSNPPASSPPSRDVGSRSSDRLRPREMSWVRNFTTSPCASAVNVLHAPMLYNACQPQYTYLYSRDPRWAEVRQDGPCQQGLEIFAGHELNFCLALKVVASSAYAHLSQVWSAGQVRDDGLDADHRGGLRCAAHVALLTAVQAHVGVGCQAAWVRRVTTHVADECGCLW